MIPVCHNLRCYANKVFKGMATDWKGTMGWCHGFKLHFTCNDRGEIITFCLTGANVDDRNPGVYKREFELLFTPPFHGKACSKSHRIDNMNNSLKPSVRNLKKGGENERIVPLIKSGASPQFIVYLSNKKVCIYLSDEPPTTELVAGTFYVWQTPNHTHILYEKGTDYPSVLRRYERKAWHGNYYPFPCR
ncbi:transposase DDE domain protein [Bacteroides fragilis str. 1007-1-F |nr:transposase DDE domain protein [Bacteroides fragilis str. 3783N2-1]EXZ34757.1 transposase DDE domain protein [Bacteroides fragilis str. 1007-1-F \